MSALNTFDWYVEALMDEADDEMKRFIDLQRSSLLNMREEDERQRFVLEFIRELNLHARARKKKS